MRKQEIDSILIANYYFTKCRIESPTSDRTELARKYLFNIVGRAIVNRKKLSISSPLSYLYSFF